MPLRQGVLLIAAITFLACFIETLGLSTDDIRLETGGFSWFARSLLGSVGLVGLVCSLAGITGCYDSNSRSLRSFWHFTPRCLLTLFFAFGLDHATLARCERWRWKLVGPPGYLFLSFLAFVPYYVSEHTRPRSPFSVSGC